MIKLPTLATQLRRPPERPRKPVLRAVRWPHGEEQMYAATLLFEAKQACRGIQSRLLPKLPTLLGRAERRLRSDDLREDLAALIADLREKYNIPTRTARRWAIQMLEGVNAQQAAEMAAAYQEVLTLNPLLGKEKWFLEAMRVALDENVALIKSIPEQLLDQVARMVQDAVLSGMRAEELALALVGRFGVTENRALLIGMDQVGKWHGQLQRLRQLDAGIVSYEWSTSNDERVRASHRAREGKEFRWDSPPPGGSHPGLEVRCRCVAIPVIPDWEE